MRKFDHRFEGTSEPLQEPKCNCGGEGFRDAVRRWYPHSRQAPVHLYRHLFICSDASFFNLIDDGFFVEDGWASRGPGRMEVPEGGERWRGRDPGGWQPEHYPPLNLSATCTFSFTMRVKLRLTQMLLGEWFPAVACQHFITTRNCFVFLLRVYVT